MIYDNLEDLTLFGGPYDLVVSDPPWVFSNANFKRNCGRREKADFHYLASMTPAEIKALPLPDITAQTSVLVLWTTDAHIPFALDCIKHWGFRYSTQVFVWVKLQNGKPVKNLGPWTMKSCEVALLATKGKAHSTLLATQAESQLIYTERGRHSEKPRESYDRLERMFPDTVKLDMFARKTLQGWDSFGNEVESECLVSKSSAK